MKDISLVIVKPEIISRTEQVISSLRKRGYDILLQKAYTGWRELAKKIYTEFTPEQIKVYLSGYDKHNWNDDYMALIVSHKEGNTLKRLKQEQGNYVAYQTQKENTLRAEFGCLADKNLYFDDITFTYTGIHCSADEKELGLELKLLHLDAKTL